MELELNDILIIRGERYQVIGWYGLRPTERYSFAGTAPEGVLGADEESPRWMAYALWSISRTIRRDADIWLVRDLANDTYRLFEKVESRVPRSFKKTAAGGLAFFGHEGQSIDEVERLKRGTLNCKAYVSTDGGEQLLHLTSSIGYPGHSYSVHVYLRGNVLDPNEVSRDELNSADRHAMARWDRSVQLYEEQCEEDSEKMGQALRISALIVLIALLAAGLLSPLLSGA